MYFVNPNSPLSSTGNLTPELRLCVGARVMVSDNLDVPDKLINGSSRTIFYLYLERRAFLVTVIVKFGNPIAGNFMKTYGGELRENGPCCNQSFLLFVN